jgi:hypothetical protein
MSIPRPSKHSQARLYPAMVTGLVAIVAFGCGGCASTSPNQDAHFGEATRRLNEQQRLVPNASQANEGKTFEADGRTVRASQNRMLDTYRAPPAPISQSLDTVGSGGSGTSGSR